MEDFPLVESKFFGGFKSESFRLTIKNCGGVSLGTVFVADVVYHGLYTNDELIIDIEMEVLQALTWRLNGPSPHEFIDAVVGLLPASSVNGSAASLLLLKQSKTKVEADVLHYDQALQSSSSLVYTTILTTLQTTSNVLNGFEPTNLIDWMSNIKSVMTGSSMYQPFVKGIGVIVQFMLF